MPTIFLIEEADRAGLENIEDNSLVHGYSHCLASSDRLKELWLKLEADPKSATDEDLKSLGQRIFSHHLNLDYCLRRIPGLKEKLTAILTQTSPPLSHERLTSAQDRLAKCLLLQNMLTSKIQAIDNLGLLSSAEPQRNGSVALQALITGKTEQEMARPNLATARPSSANAAFFSHKDKPLPSPPERARSKSAPDSLGDSALSMIPLNTRDVSRPTGALPPIWSSISRPTGPLPAVPNNADRPTAPLPMPPKKQAG